MVIWFMTVAITDCRLTSPLGLARMRPPLPPPPLYDSLDDASLAAATAPGKGGGTVSSVGRGGNSFSDWL